jgi:hypothetical protein
MGKHVVWKMCANILKEHAISSSEVNNDLPLGTDISPSSAQWV